MGPGPQIKEESPNFVEMYYLWFAAGSGISSPRKCNETADIIQTRGLGGGLGGGGGLGYSTAFGGYFTFI